MNKTLLEFLSISVIILSKLLICQIVELLLLSSTSILEFCLNFLFSQLEYEHFFVILLK